MPFFKWSQWSRGIYRNPEHTANRSIPQIPECTCSISHNAPFRTEMCTFLFWMEHCGIWNKCILGFLIGQWSTSAMFDLVWLDQNQNGLNHVCFMRPDFLKPNLVSQNLRAYRWQFVYSYVVSGSRFKIQIYFPIYLTWPMVLFWKLFTSIKIKWIEIKMKFNAFASSMPYVISIVINTFIIRVTHGL